MSSSDTYQNEQRTLPTHTFALHLDVPRRPCNLPRPIKVTHSTAKPNQVRPRRWLPHEPSTFSSYSRRAPTPQSKSWNSTSRRKPLEGCHCLKPAARPCQDVTKPPQSTSGIWWSSCRMESHNSSILMCVSHPNEASIPTCVQRGPNNLVG